MAKHDLATRISNLCRYFNENQLPENPNRLPYDPNMLPETPSDPPDDPNKPLENPNGPSDDPNDPPDEYLDDFPDGLNNSSDAGMEDGERPWKRQKLGGGSFLQRGQTVAIYYDELFHLRQVLVAEDEGSAASVSFMSKVPIKNVFIWPEIEDIATVEAKFVFAWDIKLSSTKGRTWLAEKVDDIIQSYKAYKDRFC